MCFELASFRNGPSPCRLSLHCFFSASCRCCCNASAVLTRSLAPLCSDHLVQRIAQLEAALEQQQAAAAAQQAQQQERLHQLDRQLATAAAAASPMVGCLLPGFLRPGYVPGVQVCACC